ncbi:hypothetical protein MTR_0054s0230 [Medicago truncatula]|uniref:Uncharacterized protein n=1 Tax=Medicago truncatula TaxID=3880 RepID=A0A072THX3_MEDTR|nr:hypothetical protein MTR_0054s0230 [Medicago truncatula]
MHVVPTRASSPQHKSINTLIGHQALNIKSKSSQGIKPSTYRAKAHRASSPQLKSVFLTGQLVMASNLLAMASYKV